MRTPARHIDCALKCFKLLLRQRNQVGIVILVKLFRFRVRPHYRPRCGTVRRNRLADVQRLIEVRIINAPRHRFSLILGNADIVRSDLIAGHKIDQTDQPPRPQGIGRQARTMLTHTVHDPRLSFYGRKHLISTALAVAVLARSFGTSGIRIRIRIVAAGTLGRSWRV